MTHCTGAPAEQWLDEYVAGALADGDAQAFEEHYFDCPECLAQLQAAQAARAGLARSPVEARRYAFSWFPLAGALTAAAALLLVAIGYRAVVHKAGQPTVAIHPAGSPPHGNPQSLVSGGISALADLALPAFHATTVRGQDEESAFEKGMKAYASGDCAHAQALLRKVPRKTPDALAAEFYAAVCQMHQGDFASASDGLRQVAGAGDSPLQEAAFYYLAQIALAGNDAAAARNDLARTIELHGDFEKRAGGELAQIQARTSRK